MKRESDSSRFEPPLTHRRRPGGEVRSIAASTRSLFNFREIRYFDIEGKAHRAAVARHDQSVRQDPHPDHESQDDKSQIEEYCASITAKASSTLPSPPTTSTARWTCCDGTALRSRTRPTPIMRTSPPRARPSGVAHRAAQPPHPDRWQSRQGRGRAAADLHAERHRSIFFESSEEGQRSFGEGNFRALFESIEQDQIRRGVI